MQLRSQEHCSEKEQIQASAPHKPLKHTNALYWNAVTVQRALDAAALHREEVLTIRLSQHVGDGLWETHGQMRSKTGPAINM